MSETKNIYAAHSDADLLRLMRQQPLAWIVSGSAESFRATLLPLLAQTDAEGRVVRLTGAQREDSCCSCSCSCP